MYGIITESKQGLVGLWVSRKDLQRHIGRLQFIGKCVVLSRRSMNRILDSLRSAPYKGKIPISADLIRDISWFVRSAKHLPIGWLHSYSHVWTHHTRFMCGSILSCIRILHVLCRESELKYTQYLSSRSYAV